MERMTPLTKNRRFNPAQRKAYADYELASAQRNMATTKEAAAAAEQEYQRALDKFEALIHGPESLGPGGEE